MSMYNMIFGKDPNSELLLEMLELEQGDFYRFRDCYLTEDNEIAVYTRGGGGNRECYCDDYYEVDELSIADAIGDLHEKGCVVLTHERNHKHPNYIHDADDYFDSTYATFYFSVPAELDRERLVAVELTMARDDLWQIFIKSLER